MKPVSLTTYPRTLSGRNQLKQLRAQSRIPAILYGNKIDDQTLELPYKQMIGLINHSASEHILVDMSIEGDAKGNRLAMVKEVQHHPLSGEILHVDFHEVNEKEPVTVTVPVETLGEAAGVKQGGGILEHVLHKVKAKGLPLQIPEIIQLDITELQVADVLTVGDIQLPEGVEILGDKSILVVTVKPPRVSEEAASEEEGEGEEAEEKKD